MHIVKNDHRTGHLRGMFSVVLLGASTLATAAGAQVPTVVFGSSVGINNQAPINGNFGNGKGGYEGTTQHMAANARGDMFFHANPYGGQTPAYGADYLAELPYNGTSLVEIVSNIGPYTSGVATDANGNIYLPDGSGNGQIDYIPLVGGVYATGVNASTLAACTLPLSGDTTPCVVPLILTGVTGYFQPKDIQVDAAGDLFIYPTAGKIILAPVPAAGATGYALQYVAAPSATPASGVTPSLAADSAGDLYYSDGNAVTYYTAAALSAAYTSTSGGGTSYAAGTSVGSGLSGPQGISIDSAGNLYIGDTGHTRIVVLPLISGTRSTANQYTLTSGVTVNAGFAVDGYGDIYYENGNSLDEITLGSLQLASGNQYYSPTTNVTLTFTSGGTLNSSAAFKFTGSNAAAFTVSSGNTTCSAGTTYAAGGSCVLSIEFSQQNATLETAAVSAISSTGNVLGSSLLYGFPAGPGLYLDPGTVTTVGSGWTAPASVTVGNLGSVFVADSTTGNIYNSAGGAAQTTVATGFSSPSAVVVDPVGNLYVADTGNHQIVEVPYVSGAYGAHQILTTGLSGPSGLSIAANGALFVADSGNGRVLILDKAAGQGLGTLSATLLSGLTTPVSVAADSYGHLYIADAGTKKVISLNLSTHAQTTIVSGATTLAGVAAAPDGSVYVIDSGAKTLTKIPAPLQVLAPNSAVTIPNPVVTPSGIATDADNNLYVIDKTGAAVVEINRSAATLNFGALASGGTSPTLTVTATNPGNGLGTASNGALALYGISAPAAPFSAVSSSTCPTTFPQNSAPQLAGGATCTYAVQFSPTSGGSGTQTVTFSSSGGQGSQAGFVNGTVLLEGNLPTITGLASSVYGSGPSYTLKTGPDGTYNVSITGTATASASVTVSGGTGTFALPTIGVGSYTLSYTDANSNTAQESITVTPATLTVSVTGSPARLFGQANPVFAYTISGFVSPDTVASATTGAASVTTTATPKSAAGSYAIVVAQGTLAAANYTFAETNGSLTVNGGAVQAILFPALANYTHGTTVTLAAETTSGLPVTYTVTNGTGTATVSGNTLTITGAGTISVTAAQAGNGNFSAATSVTRTFTAQ